MISDNYIYIVLALAALILVSCLIPLYGFLRSRWNGLALGCCLFQPLMLVLSFLLISWITYTRDRNYRSNCRDNAMVTLRNTVVEEGDTLSYLWYLKADEECYEEIKQTGDDEKNDSELYDVVLLDSTSVGVEDRIVVTFDRKNRTVTATDEDKPIEVVSVNWDEVEEYFSRNKDVK